MKTITFLGQQVPIENMRNHYRANANGLRKMAERSLKTGKYNGFTTTYLTEKAKQYEEFADKL